MHEAAGIAHALNKGREQGLQEGLLKGKEEVKVFLHLKEQVLDDMVATLQ